MKHVLINILCILFISIVCSCNNIEKVENDFSKLIIGEWEAESLIYDFYTQSGIKIEGKEAEIEHFTVEEISHLKSMGFRECITFQEDHKVSIWFEENHDVDIYGETTWYIQKDKLLFEEDIEGEIIYFSNADITIKDITSNQMILEVKSQADGFKYYLMPDGTARTEYDKYSLPWGSKVEQCNGAEMHGELIFSRTK